VFIICKLMLLHRLATNASHSAVGGCDGNEQTNVQKCPQLMHQLRMTSHCSTACDFIALTAARIADSDVGHQ